MFVFLCLIYLLHLVWSTLGFLLKSGRPSLEEDSQEPDLSLFQEEVLVNYCYKNNFIGVTNS